MTRLIAPSAITGTTSVSDGSGDWREHAECLAEDPELFYPVGETSAADRDQAREAKAVCARCPVTDTCLQYALTEGIDTGIWGGLTEKERRSMRRRNRATKDAPTAERDARRAAILTELPGLAADGLSIHEAAITLNTAANYITRILTDQPDLLEQLRRNTHTPRHDAPAGPAPSAPAALLEELEHLADLGVDIHEAARVTGRKVSYLERLAQDRGRHDLIARLRRTAA